MKAFLGSMTGRVFLVLLLGIVASAALTQWLAVGERTRALERYRDFHALERAEQLITTADVMPDSARPTYLAATSRGTVRLEATDMPVATALPPTEFSTGTRAAISSSKPSRPAPSFRPGCEASVNRAAAWRALRRHAAVQTSRRAFVGRRFARRPLRSAGAGAISWNRCTWRPSGR